MYHVRVLPPASAPPHALSVVAATAVTARRVTDRRPRRSLRRRCTSHPQERRPVVIPVAGPVSRAVDLETSRLPWSAKCYASVAQRTNAHDGAVFAGRTVTSGGPRWAYPMDLREQVADLGHRLLQQVHPLGGDGALRLQQDHLLAHRLRR